MNEKVLNIMVFIEGNGDSVDTWSNIPYFLIRSLEQEGATVYRTDIGAASSPQGERFFLYLVDIMTRCVRKIIRNNITFGLNRTGVYYKVVERKMRQALKKNTNIQGAITLNFSHSAAKFTSCPTCMLCDWTIEYLIEKHQHRTPGVLEKIAIERQKKEILATDYVITLFPDVREYMQEKYHKEILYLGNVINSDLMDCSAKEVIGKKYKGNHYLFIGRERYIDGAIQFVRAVKSYNCTHEDKIVADIIGLDKKAHGELDSENIMCYGYLSKGDTAQKEQYYHLLMNARAIVNTTEEWNGMSSLIEAMYYYTPIVVVPNLNIEKTFGEKCDCGIYCKSNAMEELVKAIDRLHTASYEDYREICNQAHRKVEEFTWSNYAQKIIEVLT